MLSANPRFFCKLLGICFILLLSAQVSHARCFVKLNGRIILVRDANCAQVNGCLQMPVQCIDLLGIIHIESNSSTKAFIIMGKERYELASDNETLAFNKLLKENMGKPKSISQQMLDYGIKENGIKGTISNNTLENLATEFNTKVTYIKEPAKLQRN